MPATGYATAHIKAAFPRCVDGSGAKNLKAGFSQESMVLNAICRFLIHRYMGEFLNKRVQPDDLALRLREGVVSLSEVELNVNNMNSLLEPYGLVHVVEGYIGSISLHLPNLSKLLEQSLEIQIKGLEITLNPLKEVTLSNAQDLVNSMTEILSRSISLDASASADYFDENEDDLDNEAVADFASKIDLIITRMKVTFTNVVIRIESEHATVSTALEVHIDHMEFVDELAAGMSDGQRVITSQPMTSAGDVRKLLRIKDVRLFTDVFTPITSVSSASVGSDTQGNILPPDLVGSMATSSLNYQSCYTHVSDTKEPRTSEKVPSTPVQIAHLFGNQHTIRISVHNAAVANGDGAYRKKIEIDVNMSGFLFFMLSPSQLVLLQDLLSRLVPKSNVDATRFIPNDMPMKAHQYDQLTNQLQTDNLYRNSQPRHWTTNNFQDLSAATPGPAPSSSTFKGDMYQVALDSSPLGPSSSYPVSENNYRDDIDDSDTATETATQRGSSSVRGDTCTQAPDIFSFSIRTPNIVGIITHEDPMGQDNIKKTMQEEGPDAVQIVVNKMAKKSEEFFEAIKNIKLSASEQLSKQRHLFDNVYDKDHLRLMMQNADIRFVSESGGSQDMIDFSMSSKRFDLCESLTKESVHGATKGALFDIFNCGEASTGLTFRLKTCNTEQDSEYLVEVNVQPCKSEIDPSMIDRLSHLFVTKPFFNPSPLIHYERSYCEDLTDSNKLFIRFYCPNWEVDLRIPVADFSTSSVPYNVRNVHSQYLKLEMTKMQLSIPRFRPEDIATFGRLDLRCSSIASYFMGDLDCSEADRRFMYATIPTQERPFLSISYDFRNKSLNNTDRVLEPMAQSMTGSFFKFNDTDSPFSKKNAFFDGEKLVLSGTRDELAEFSSNCHDNSDVNFELYLSTMNLHLSSKHFFEVLYNRFGSDLALFTLKAPSFLPQDIRQVKDAEVGLRFLEISGEDDNYQLDNREYEDHSESLINTKKSHKFSLTLAVDSGRVLLGTVGHEGDKQFKSQIGIELDKVDFFFVFGYQGDVDLAYCYIAAERNTIVHRNLFDGVVPFPSDVRGRFMNRHSSDVFAEPLKSIELCKIQDDHNVAVAIKLHSHIDTDNGKELKDILLAISARNTVINLRPFTNPAHFWFGQLSEFFNVEDAEIPNYDWPVVSIDLNVHLSSVVLAYDHKNVIPESPMQLRIAVGSCDLTGNIVHNMEAYKFRCYLQESMMFLGKADKNRVRFGEPRLTGLRQFVKFLGLEVLKVEFDYTLGLTDEKTGVISSPSIETLLRDGDLKAWVCHDTIVEFFTLINEFMKSEYAAAFITPEVDGDSGEENFIPEPTISAEILETISSAMQDTLKSDSKTLRRNDSCDEFGDNDDFNDSNLSNDDEFVVVDEIPGSGITNPAYTIPQVRVFVPNFEIIPGYLTMLDTKQKDDMVDLPEGHPNPIFKYRIQDFSLHVLFYGGSDFGDSQPMKPYSKWEELRESNDCYREGSVGGAFRDHTACVEMNVNKINFTWQRFDPEAPILSLKMLTIHNIEVLDHCLVSSIKKMFFRLAEEGKPQRLLSPMLSLRMVEDQKREGKMKVSLLPLRLNIDQDTYDFLNEFFANVGTGLADLIESETVKTFIPPMCEIPGVSEGHVDVGFTTSSALQDAVNTNFGDPPMGLSEEFTRQVSMDEAPAGSANLLARRQSTFSAASRTNLQDTFYKEFTFSPPCKICIDYIGKRIDVNHQQGAVVGIACGVLQSDKTELVLKELNNEQGLLGYSKCLEYAVEQWIEDLMAQLPRIVGSLGPLTPFTALVSGVRDLIYLPLTEFRRQDGHVVQGLQRGASSFGLAAAVTALDMTQWVFSGFHTIAEFTYDVISPDYPTSGRGRREQAERDAMPADLRQGFSMACETIYQDVSRTANTIKRATNSTHSGASGVKNIIRAAPVVVGAPVVSLSKVMTLLLSGAKSQLNPGGFADDRNKYRR